MAREGITYEQVAAAADELVAANSGRRPTLQAIRAKLGTGSPNTIHRHLTSWKATLAVADVAKAELPTVIARAFHHELGRAVAEARQDLEQQLRDSQEENVALATDGEAREAELMTATAELRALTSELDTLRRRADEQAAELEHVARDLASERAAVANVRDQAAEMRIVVDDLRAKLSDRALELDAAREELQRDRQERIEIERKLAAVQATNVALEERLEERKAREDALSSELAEARQRNELLSERDRTSASELARRESELQARSEELQSRSKELQSSQNRELDVRAQLDSTIGRERELVRELSRAQAALEALQQAQEGTLERARLKWELEQRAERGKKS